jgi:hypothetical protein
MTRGRASTWRREGPGKRLRGRVRAFMFSNCRIAPALRLMPSRLPARPSPRPGGDEKLDRSCQFCCARVRLRATPHPNPPPQGGRGFSGACRCGDYRPRSKQKPIPPSRPKCSVNTGFSSAHPGPLPRGKGASAPSNLRRGVRDRGAACVTEGPVRNSGPYSYRRSPMVLALTTHSFLFAVS